MKVHIFGTIVLILMIAVLPHSLNMFAYPYYEADEGTYFSQAWSFAEFGKLSPYEYWYDHAPLGWIFMALWIKVVGIFTFGFSLNSGRVFMLILQVVSALLLYSISYRLTKSKFAGLVSVVFFSLSPLAIYFHRRILLDNISVFWLLLSLFFLTGKFNKVTSLVLSAVFSAIAVLTKETALLFIPAYIYLVYKEAGEQVYFIPPNSKKLLDDSVLWIAIFIGVLLLYPAYALSRGELFGGSGVSLVDAIAFQLGRGSSGTLVESLQNFAANLKIWFQEDPLYIFIGAISVIVSSILGFKNKTARVLALLILPMVLYLIFSGTVFEFYVVMLLPFLALNIAYIFSFTINASIKRRYAEFLLYGTLAVSAFLMALYFSDNSKNEFNLYTTDQTRSQTEAVDWLKSHVSPGSVNVIDNYAYVDLNAVGLDARYDYYWKIDTDPSITHYLLNNSIQKIDYIAVTPQMSRDAEKFENLELTRQLISQSNTVELFESPGWSVDIKQNR